MAVSSKDTIYIDIDDEITSVIEKVKSSKQQIVALVLPKRAAVFQSLVNLKLLKRAADESKKRPVLITSESAVLSIAGVAGLYTAKTLQSKPEISQTGPVGDDKFSELAAGEANDNQQTSKEDAPLDPHKPIGELAGIPAVDDNIEVDNTNNSAVSGGKQPSKKPKDKKFKIPNFNKFRTKLVLALAAIILLVGGWVMAFLVLPKANVVIATDSSNHQVDIVVSANTQQDEVDAENFVLPATLVEAQHTDAETVSTSGERDEGSPASGNVLLRNCTDDAVTIPSGTGVSNGNFTYATQSGAELGPGDFTSPGSGGECRASSDASYRHEAIVGVVATENGENYNAGARTYTVSGFAGVTGHGSEMTGGTTDIKQIVTQDDISVATRRIEDRGSSSMEEDLQQQLEADGLLALAITLQSGEPQITSSPNVDDEAQEVTVNAVTTYEMLGINEDQLNELIEQSLAEEVDFTNQRITDNGLTTASISLENRDSANQATVRIQATVTVGADINEQNLKEEIAGKKTSETEELVRGLPGVEDVEVRYSPFWVSKTPNNADKITITVNANESAD